MKPKVVAIATADHHIHKFQAFNENNSRLTYALNALKEIFDIAKSYNVPILFAGDLIHSPKNIETETNNRIQGFFKEQEEFNPNTPFIAISGNHDMSERSGINQLAPSHLDSIIRDDFIHLKHGMSFSGKDFRVWGIQYMNNDQDLKKVIMELKPKVKEVPKNKIKILLLHSDMPGAKTPEGFVIGEVEAIPKDLDKFFKEWDLVLCGHIHRPQKLSKKVYMLGCPIQQNEGNIGYELGYWKIFSDNTVKFVPMNNYPKFIRLKAGEEAPDKFNYYIKPDEVLVEDEVELGEFNINNSKSKLAESYCTLKQIKSKAKKRALIKILNEE